VGVGGGALRETTDSRNRPLFSVDLGSLLDPGEAVDLEASGGTASCDLALGYVLPAGTYEARALVDYQEPVTFESRAFWSEPTLIEVVAP